MNTFRVFLALALYSCAIAAPSTDETAECAPPKGAEKEVIECCQLPEIFGNAGAKAAFKECIGLIKEKPTEGDKMGKPPKPEGFECMDDCLFSKLGLLSDKKINEAAVAGHVKTAYTGDWAEIGTKANEKCLAAAKSVTEKICPTGSDVYAKCMFRESYMNCPEKTWTNSDACKANKERLLKCPRAIPFIGPIMAGKE